MPIGYLLPTLIMAWCVLCAVGPRRWHLGSGWIRFRCSMVINELPALGLYWIAVTTAWTVAQGEIATPVGWIALAINCMAGAGLVVIVARQRQAGPTLRAALEERMLWARPGTPAMGKPPPSSRGRAVGLLLLPRRSRRRDVERIADIAYGDAGRANALDLYRSRSAQTGRPVLIHLHGGALRRGGKNREGLPLIYGLANRGWLCISANYRLSPKATFPDHLIDVKRVVAWVRTHASDYGGNPDVIFLAGGSSGAQLAALAALTAKEPRYQPGFENVDTAITAAITLYGIYGRRSVAGMSGSDVLPAEHLSADAPPFLIVHGDADSVLSVNGARDFATDLRQVSEQPVVYAELPGAQHSFDLFTSLRSTQLLAAVEQFADHVRRPVSPPHNPRRPDPIGSPKQSAPVSPEPRKFL